MRIKTERFPEIPDEQLPEFSYSIKNFLPSNVRRSLRRAKRRADSGPDCNLDLLVMLKDGVEVPPAFAENPFRTICFKPEIIKGNLTIYDLNTNSEKPDEEGLDEYSLPLAAVAAMQVNYRMWESK